LVRVLRRGRRGGSRLLEIRKKRGKGEIGELKGKGMGDVQGERTIKVEERGENPTGKCRKIRDTLL